MLLLGRALQGLGSGCSWSASSVYITEIAPPAYRGALVAISDIAINVGILLGYAVDRVINLTIVSASVRWRVAMGLSVIVPLTYGVLYPLVPETPRLLTMHGKRTEAAQVRIRQNLSHRHLALTLP